MSESSPRMSRRLRVGCPMWAHRPWIGRHFPEGTRAGRELEAYATWCNAVEGNTTFYALPDVATVDRWRDQTGADFRFVCKLSRAITHDRRLRDAGPELRDFCSRLEPLGDRLGPTMIQLPPSFSPQDLDLLGAFLETLPSAWSWAVEVRHPGFFDGDRTERRLNDLLAHHRVERVTLDSRCLFAAEPRTPIELETHQRKPRVPVRAVAIGEQPVIRFIGQNDPAASPPFWKPWVRKICDWVRAGRQPIMFVHTPDNLAAPPLARAFHAEVSAALDSELAPLPNPLTTNQAALW